MKIKLLTASVIAFAAATSASAATFSGFGNPIDNPNLTGGTVINFDSLPAGDFPSVTDQGVTFTGVGAPITIGPDFNGQFNTSGGQSLLTGFDEDPDQIDFTFSTAVSAFGFNFGASDNNWLLTAYDASNSVVDSLLIGAVFSSNAGDYFGIAGTGIVRATLVDQLNNIRSGDYIFIDDFTYKATNVIPVPAGLPLLLTGIGVFGFLRRKRKA